MTEHTDDFPALAPLRTQLEHMDAPARVEKALMAAFARQHKATPWYRRLTLSQWGMAGGLGSAMAVAAVFILTLQAPLPGVLAATDDRGDFIALLPLDQIAAEKSPRMVEADLPRTALDALGVPVTPENAGATVRAEMLLREDGEPMALRLSMN
jgi:hypothetical protein